MNAGPIWGGDDKEPVWLAVVGGQFGQEFIVGDAGRCGELGFGADPCADFFRDLCRRGDTFEVFGDIEIGLIQGQRLDKRRVSGKDRVDLSRDLLVDLEARFH